MRSILSIVLVTSCGIMVGCGGSNEPAKQPGDVQTTSQTTQTMPTSDRDPKTWSGQMGTTPPTSSSIKSATDGTSDATPTSTPAPAMTPLSDAEIVAFTSAANNGEIEMAKVVLKSTQNAQVKAFANMMVKEHGEAEAKGKKLAQTAKITPAENDLSTKLKTDGEGIVTSLKSQKGADLDRAYMDSQVKVHREVLSTIDDKLLPSVKNGELKTHLGEVRQHVSMHLTKAQEISASLTGNASTK